MAFKVLVADDSVTIHRLVSLALKEEDIEIYTVSNGDDAIQKIKEIKPDVVLADIFMPRKTGYEVCSFVKGDPSISYIPVVLLVGTFEPFDEEEAKSSGYDGVLVKPFETEQLLKVVKSSIQKSITNRTDVSEKEGDEFAETVLDKTIMVDSFEEEESVSKPIPELETSVKTVKARVEAPELKSMDSVIQEYGGIEKKISETGDLDILDISDIKIESENIDYDEDILGVYDRVSFNSTVDEEELFEEVGEVSGEAELEEEVLIEDPEVGEVEEEEIIIEEENIPEQISEEEVIIEEKEDTFESESEGVVEVENQEEVKIEELPKSEVSEVNSEQLVLNDELIEKIAEKVVQKLSAEIIEKIAWEVVPELSELIIKKSLEDNN